MSATGRSGGRVSPGADALRGWLARHRLSQKALAERVGSSQATISKILNGRARPGLVLAEKIGIATRFASPEDRHLVTPVPARLWFSPDDQAECEGLRRIVEMVRDRARGE
jgi:transcriptional regulator with XRE-family HTH domain